MLNNTIFYLSNIFTMFISHMSIPFFEFFVYTLINLMQIIFNFV